MEISPELMRDVVEHAQRDAPEECCGVVAVRDGAAVKVFPLENVFSWASKRYAFEIDGMELHRVMSEIEDSGAELGAIYHSHTRSDPVPSQTDINFAAGWPGTEWLIVGTKADPPDVRSFLIDGGVVTQVPVE